jgi:hypothetical protein
LSSDGLKFKTEQSVPTGLSNLTFIDIPISSTHLHVNISWNPPSHPNGNLRSLILTRDSQLIYSISSPTLLLKPIYFLDKPLKYGFKYSYTLRYDNDVGSVSISNCHTTKEAIPSMNMPIRCLSTSSNEIDVIFEEPEFPNGKIVKYLINYSELTNNISIRTIQIEAKTNKTVYQIKLVNLRAFSPYKISVTSCNRIGCSSNNQECFTRDSIQFEAPKVIQLGDDYSRPQLKISWKSPILSDDLILSYELFRVTLKTSISYDFDYTPINHNKMSKLCSGKSFGYIDSDLFAFSTYEYFVVVTTFTGQITSPFTSKFSILTTSFERITIITTISYCHFFLLYF